MMYRTTFKVMPLHRLPSRFPIDMLRYDRCMPHTEADSSIISASLSGEEPPFNDGVVLMTLHTYGKPKHLTDERWRSFGWCVVPQSVVTVKV